MTEAVEYRNIEGFPGYRIGSNGSVWSLWKFNARPSRMGVVWNRLKPQVSNRHGHHRVNLCKDGRRNRMLVHRLVLEAFVGKCPEGMECCHNDGNPANNNVNNLRWDTHRQNLLDRVLHQTDCRGVRSGTAKLTDDIVAEVLTSSRLGASNVELAKRYGVNKTTIRMVVCRKTWKHVLA